MFNWNSGTINDDPTVVHGARITPDNIWMTKYLLSGKPDRIRVAINHYLVNRGSREQPDFILVRQGHIHRE